MGIFLEMLVCGDITATTSCTKLTCRHAVDQIGTLWLHSTWQQLLYSCSKYFGVKHCFLLNNAQCTVKNRMCVNMTPTFGAVVTPKWCQCNTMGATVTP